MISLQRRGIIGGGATGGSTLRNTLALNGSNQYVQIPTGMDLGSNDFTISIQANIDNLSRPNILVSQWQTTGNQRAIDFLVNPTNLQFNYSFAGSGGGGGATALFTWTPVVDTQYSIVLERNGADLKAFIDGSQIGSTHDISTNSIHASTAEVRVGEALYTLTDALSGNVANLIITSNSGNVTELQTVKQPEDYTTAITSNLIMAFPFNDGVVDPEDDRSANAWDATLINSPTYGTPTIEYMA
jgi:hypothetical protein